MSASRSEIYREHNEIKKRKRSSGLDASAQIVAHRLARRDKGIEHARFWWKVIDKTTKRRYGAKAENLALDFDSVNPLMAAWLRSPLHAKNIRAGNTDSIGIGIAMGRRTKRPYYVVHFGGK